MSNSGHLSFDVSFGKPSDQPADRPAGKSAAPTGAPSAVLVIANLSGHTAQGDSGPLATRPTRVLDIDTYMTVFRQFNTQLKLSVAGTGQTLQFKSIDDFHPDQLLANIPPLSLLNSVRRRLASPATAAAAAGELSALLGPQTGPAPAAAAAPVASAPVPSESNEAALARLLGKPPGASASTPASASPENAVDATALIRRLVGNVAAPALPPGAAGMQSAVELELAALLRSVLHDPTFQALEAAWRSVDFLVRRWPEENAPKLRVLDASMAELAADPVGLLRHLRDQPGTVVALDGIFGESAGSLGTLKSLAAVCAKAHAVLLAGAHPQLVRCDSFGRHADPDDWCFPAPEDVQTAWAEVCDDPAANHASLSLPRFLLRLPYGRGGEPIDAFPFEEFVGPPDHEAMPWGNPAFLRALLRAQTAASGGDAPGGEIDQLPVYSFRQDGAKEVVPCAEAWLSERAAARIGEAGLVPVLSVKNSDSVLIPEA